MAYSAFYVFGDSLVDAGNALKLAQWYGTLTLSDLPDGAPTADQGYYKGRFSNGYVFTDLLSNKLIGQVSKPVFPFGYEDPWLDLPVAPFASDPSGNNLNFAYGGAQIRQGDEVVSDLDGQTDAFRDAVDGDADPNALYSITIGGNDIRSLVPTSSGVTGPAEAYAILDERAEKMLLELSQLVEDGAKNFLITGVPDVGLIARYDRDGNNILGPDMDLNGDGIIDLGEASRSALASEYAAYLDMLIRTVVIPELEAMGATVTYVPLMDYVDESTGQIVTGALSANLETIAYLNGVVADEPGETAGEHLQENMLLYDSLIFFDGLHPTAQAHALLASFMNAKLQGTAWVETMPLLGAEVDHLVAGTISAIGEIDNLVIATAANTTYTFQMLGASSLTEFVLGEFGITALPAGQILADPQLVLKGSNGAIIASDDDSGAGLDSSMVVTMSAAGTYTVSASAVGSLSGSYVFTITVDGSATTMGNSYIVSNASALVIEGAGWAGVDSVNASVSYALMAGSEIEVLQTTNARGKGSINLTGNEFDQHLVGNAGANILEGKGGADKYTGGAGNDRFVLGKDAVIRNDGSQIDQILDYAKGDVVDVTQVLSLAAGAGLQGFLRVTSTGKIQVDIDGGGNSWVTISTINGSGSVAVRYVSNGTATTVTLARVPETYVAGTTALAAAAAGIVAADSSDLTAASVAGSDPGDSGAANGAAQASVLTTHPAMAVSALEGEHFGRILSAIEEAKLDVESHRLHVQEAIMAAGNWTRSDAEADTDESAALIAEAPVSAPAAMGISSAMPALTDAVIAQLSATIDGGETVSSHATTSEVGRILADALDQPGYGTSIDALLVHLGGDGGNEPGTVLMALRSADWTDSMPLPRMPHFAHDQGDEAASFAFG